MAYTVQLVWNSTVRDVTMSGTEVELFQASVRLPAGATDTALLLNLLTDPTCLVVYGASGISFKLDAGGVDAIAANPFAVVTDEDGLAIDRILLSNSSGVEQTVYIYSAQES